MKIQILKENLAKTIQLVARFASVKAQLPVLGYLSIEANEQGIFVAATSLDVGVRVRMAGKIIEPGAVAVPAKIMGELVQSLPLGGVSLDLDENGQLSVTAQRFKAKLQTLPFGEFPPFSSQPASLGELGLDDVSKQYDLVGFSVSSDESRPVLTGFLWKWKQGAIVATDGYRLSLLTDNSVWRVEKNIQETSIVPGKAMIQILQALKDLGSKKVQVGFLEKEQQLAFMTEDLFGTVRVLGGDFPKYEGILPGELEIDLRVNKEQLLAAVRSAAIFARDSANIVKLEISGEKLTVSANTAQVGENVVEVESEMIKVGEGSIAFNSKFLLDVLTHVPGERIGFGMVDSLKPGMFYGVGLKGYTHVIMPVRVRE